MDWVEGPTLAAYVAEHRDDADALLELRFALRRLTLTDPWRWLRLNQYPDGGVARLRVYGQPSPDWELSDHGLLELSALANGGREIV